jgi:hypothetical protein
MKKGLILGLMFLAVSSLAIPAKATNVVDTGSLGTLNANNINIQDRPLPAGTYGEETSGGYMYIYVDNLADVGGIQASIFTGDGYTDGMRIARLINPPKPNDGGVFTPVTWDGSNDATFKLLPDCDECFMLAGIIYADVDGDGILDDLSTMPAKVIAAITNNNFDADDDNIEQPDTIAPTNWEDYFPTRLLEYDPLEFFALEDGSTRVGYQVPVPDPSTMILIGSGLLGLGIYARKRIKN